MPDLIDNYTEFAEYYDYILRDVDYEEWFEYLKEIMNTYCAGKKQILEIGCGTGKFGAKFASAGYSITGMDISLDMLLTAKNRIRDGFQVLCADASFFHFKNKFDFIFCVHDTVNYIIDLKKLEMMFMNVSRCMNKKSVFVFDITTEYNILSNFDNKRTDYYHKGCYIKWDNSYSADERIIKSELRFTSDSFDKKEIHIQKIHSNNEISSILAKTPLEIIGIFSDYSFDSPDENTIMINYVTKLKKA